MGCHVRFLSIRWASARAECQLVEAVLRGEICSYDLPHSAATLLLPSGSLSMWSATCWAGRMSVSH